MTTVCRRVPGPKGNSGDDGTNGGNGVNAFTTLSANFVQPVALSNVTVTVATTSWMSIGQVLFVETGGFYIIVSIPTATTVEIQNLDYTGNAIAAAVIPSASRVVAGGLKGADGALTGAASGSLAGNYPNPSIATSAVGPSELAATAVTAATYGGATQSPVFTVDADGRITSAADVTILGTEPGGASGGDLVGTYPNPTLAASGVTAATYGTQELSPIVTFDTKGRATSASEISAPGRYGILGKLIGADMDIITDQAFTISSTNYIVDKILVTNASIDLTNADGGIYTNAAKAGTIVVAATQVYTALDTSAKWLALTIAATPLIEVLTAGTLYLSLTGAQGSAATADLYLFGYKLS